jgi:hypothetical protein
MYKQFLRLILKDEASVSYHHKARYFFWKNAMARLHRLTLKNGPIQNLNAFEKRYYSQNGEDGLIEIIFEKIGTSKRFCVEFGIQPHEGNSMYLRARGWDVLWMDTMGDGTTIKKETITAENINQLFDKYSVPEEFDILSIDIDSNDYWVWKAIKGYSPRLVIIEYNSSVPLTESKSVVYDPQASWDGSNYFSASLLAFKRLGESKGYTLICCDNSGTNAFFVRNDLVQNHFVVKDLEQIYRPPSFGKKVGGKRAGHPPSAKKMVDV